MWLGLKCKNCDVSLTLHKSINLLTCHYCGYTYPVPTECPNCGSTEIMGRGFGIEKIEDQIAEIFPEAKIAEWIWIQHVHEMPTNVLSQTSLKAGRIFS